MPMGMVAASAHQSGKAKSATKPKTAKVIQKTFRCIRSFYSEEVRQKWISTRRRCSRKGQGRRGDKDCWRPRGGQLREAVFSEFFTSTKAMPFTPLQASQRSPSGVCTILRTTPPPRERAGMISFANLPIDHWTNSNLQLAAPGSNVGAGLFCAERPARPVVSESIRFPARVEVS